MGRDAKCQWQWVPQSWTRVWEASLLFIIPSPAVINDEAFFHSWTQMALRPVNVATGLHMQLRQADVDGCCLCLVLQTLVYKHTHLMRSYFSFIRRMSLAAAALSTFCRAVCECHWRRTGCCGSSLSMWLQVTNECPCTVSAASSVSQSVTSTRSSSFAGRDNFCLTDGGHEVHMLVHCHVK